MSETGEGRPRTVQVRQEDIDNIARKLDEFAAVITERERAVLLGVLRRAGREIDDIHRLGPVRGRRVLVNFPIEQDELRAHLRGRARLFESVLEVGDRTYRILHPASADALIDERDFDRDERLPYWAYLWPSAIALARYLAREKLAGRRAIELGCGVGLPTVVALARGAEVLATDHYEAALDFAAHNARANLIQEPETALLDWHAVEAERLGTFDLVFASDVLYERRNAPALVDLILGLLAPGGEAIFADPRRKDAPLFLELMEEREFKKTTEEMQVNQGGRRFKVLVHLLRR
jgi:predicted nicotinamide N-methyase